MKKTTLPLLGTIAIAIALVFFLTQPSTPEVPSNTTDTIPTPSKVEEKTTLHPMAIESLRSREYVGGDFEIEETLPNGTNYKQYIASYQSEGLKIYGLLTVPTAEKPPNGFPAVMFIHGYIQPDRYSTTGNYPTYQAKLANSGFVTFKPDLRGHGKSEGEAVSAHYSEKYVVDTLYAIAYLKKYADVDPSKIVYWGHSNGGEIGLRVLTISKDIQAASLWAGVVGSYEDMFETYNSNIGFLQNANTSDLVVENGLPSTNPDFWNTLDPYFYLADIDAPIQLQHGTKDTSVPIELSLSLKEELEKIDKPVEYFEYKGDDHNIGTNMSLAFQRTIDFYKAQLQPQVPIHNAKDRILKKKFGTKVSPDDSPVEPEKFSGYHTGVDFEVFPEEVNTDVKIYALCTGTIVLKSSANGYGGIVVQECTLDNQAVTVVYGHLKLHSISAKLDQTLQRGEFLGILGKGYSSETDGERKHLHLSIHKGKDVNILGYVSSPNLLDAWLDPMEQLKM